MSIVTNDSTRRLLDIARVVARVVQNQCALRFQVALAPNVLVEVATDDSGLRCLVNVAHAGDDDERKRRGRMSRQRRQAEAQARYEREMGGYSGEYSGQGLFW
jgi:hypothetical protein